MLNVLKKDRQDHVADRFIKVAPTCAKKKQKKTLRPALLWHKKNFKKSLRQSDNIQKCEALSELKLTH